MIINGCMIILSFFCARWFEFDPCYPVIRLLAIDVATPADEQPWGVPHEA